MGAGLDGLIHGDLDVAQIVQGVKNTDDIDAAFHALADESPDDIVGIMLVAQQVLTAEQHLQLGIFRVLADGTQALPGIFVQIAQAAVKGGTSPALQRIIAGLVHFFQHGQEIGDGHTGGHQRLLTVTQYRFGDFNIHISFLFSSEFRIFPVYHCIKISPMLQR